ncbi:hypothetical protein A2U01_0099131, partial [Trifolium medium]|nr:hypothetical protein [Trifolium medium]
VLRQYLEWWLAIFSFCGSGVIAGFCLRPYFAGFWCFLRAAV